MYARTDTASDIRAAAYEDHIGAVERMLEKRARAADKLKSMWSISAHTLATDCGFTLQEREALQLTLSDAFYALDQDFMDSAPATAMRDEIEQAGYDVRPELAGRA